MDFHSILFDRPKSSSEIDRHDAPPFFHDLNLDQIFESVAAGRDEYDLKPFFYMPLNNVEAITYRHDIMMDLEGESLRKDVKSFALGMRSMYELLAQAEALSYEYQKAGWFLDAVEIYCEAVSGLTNELSLTDMKSHGFQAFREYLEVYANSEDFRSLVADTKKLKSELSGVTYCFLIKENHVTVSMCAGEQDYSADVEAAFEKFKQGSVKDYRSTFPNPIHMNHVEEMITNQVARLYPDLFLSLINYHDRHRNYLDETIRRFDREVQFYIAYMEFIEKLKSVGLKFCYPEVSDQSKEIRASETFDLALANKLASTNSTVVSNDFFLKEPERIFTVSGPNQGGKTTFARTFGQLHYLAKLGYPVPGREAKLFLCDRLFTHFEKEENIENLRGKLQDELVRIHEILQQATGNSILIMNESFASTTLKDAIFLGREVMQQIIQMDMLCVCVTFIDELSSLNKTVSMVSTVAPENPVLRTYKVIRKPADGSAYAAAIAEKYGLTRESLKRRLER